MSTFRYLVALLMLVTVPAALVFWLLLHPFVGLWRRLGPVATYALLTLAMALTGSGMFLQRRVLLQGDFGTHYLLIGLGIVVAVPAVVLQLRRRKQVTFRLLAGLPEVAPGRSGVGLVTEGIYACLRHPRYVEVLLLAVALSLIANHLATYILALVALLGIYVIVALEERELISRFGAEYLEYCRRVPRFLPRRRP